MPNWFRKPQARSFELPGVSISDPASLAYLGYGTMNWTGEPVNEMTALTLSAFYRGVMLISGAMATLPMPTYRDVGNGVQEQIGSFLDNPAGPNSLTPFQWKEMVSLHIIIHGETFLRHLYGGSDQIVGLEPVHPRAVSVEWATTTPEGRPCPDGKLYRVSTCDGQSLVLTSDDITHVMGPNTNGLRGISLMNVARNSLGMGVASEKAAAKQFVNGAMIAGVLVPGPGEDLSIPDIDAIKQDINQNVLGTNNAGGIPIVNRILQFQPWAMTNADAEFLASRSFQIEEVARWLGIPPFLLMQLDKATSWGTGIAEQNKNLAQYVLNVLAKRITEKLSELLPAPRHVEFDFTELLEGSATEKSNLLLTQVNGGIRTPNEARAELNLPPVEGGDELRVPSGVMLQATLMAQTDAIETNTQAPVVGTEI